MCHHQKAIVASMMKEFQLTYIKEIKDSNLYRMNNILQT